MALYKCVCGARFDSAIWDKVVLTGTCPTCNSDNVKFCGSDRLNPIIPKVRK